MVINDVQFGCDLSDILIELKAQLSLNGIQLLGSIKDGPDNIMVSCPYHKGGQERHPSAGIKKIDGTFHCFGCGETHTLPEVISHCFGHDDMIGAYGWTWLLKNFLTVSIEERKSLDLDFGRSNSSQNIEPTYVSEEELDSYRYYHPYMWKRKMTPEIVELFDIGYDEKTKCITFPNRDIDGNCLFVARRSVNSKYFNYPRDVEKPVYGLYELRKFYEKNIIDTRESIIICESMIDAITCWVYGKRAVALNGLGTEKQFKDLLKIPCRNYIIATDMDDSGIKARQRIKSGLKGKLVTEYFWDLNIAKDINDMSKEQFDSLKEEM